MTFWDVLANLRTNTFNLTPQSLKSVQPLSSYDCEKKTGCVLIYRLYRCVDVSRVTVARQPVNTQCHSDCMRIRLFWRCQSCGLSASWCLLRLGGNVCEKVLYVIVDCVFTNKGIVTLLKPFVAALIIVFMFSIIPLLCQFKSLICKFVLLNNVHSGLCELFLTRTGLRHIISNNPRFTY